MATGAPVATPNVVSLSYGNVEVGKASAEQTVIVTNTGDAALTISNATFVTNSTQYPISSGIVGPQTTVVGPTQSAMWKIACAPTGVGTKNATFRVTSNSNGVPGSVIDIAATCSGQQGLLVVTPS